MVDVENFQSSMATANVWPYNWSESNQDGMSRDMNAPFEPPSPTAPSASYVCDNNNIDICDMDIINERHLLDLDQNQDCTRLFCLWGFPYEFDLNEDFREITWNFQSTVAKHENNQEPSMDPLSLSRGREREVKTEKQTDYEYSSRKVTKTRQRKQQPRVRTNGEKSLQLWQFLYMLVEDSRYNPSYITWLDREKGIFKFVQSKKVAHLWGQRKQRARMPYEHLSRAMRHYYKRGILSRVITQRLTYQFGVSARSWYASLTARGNPVMSGSITTHALNSSLVRG